MNDVKKIYMHKEYLDTRINFATQLLMFFIEIWIGAFLESKKQRVFFKKMKMYNLN